MEIEAPDITPAQFDVLRMQAEAGDAAYKAAQLAANNSPTTNTAERSAAYSAWDMTIGPALAVIVAQSALPVPLTMSYYMKFQDDLREAFVDEVAGKPGKGRSRRAQR